jgi:hypothetical protein
MLHARCRAPLNDSHFIALFFIGFSMQFVLECAILASSESGASQKKLTHMTPRLLFAKVTSQGTHMDDFLKSCNFIGLIATLHQLFWRKSRQFCLFVCLVGDRVSKISCVAIAFHRIAGGACHEWELKIPKNLKETHAL